MARKLDGHAAPLPRRGTVLVTPTSPGQEPPSAAAANPAPGSKPLHEKPVCASRLHPPPPVPAVVARLTVLRPREVGQRVSAGQRAAVHVLRAYRMLKICGGEPHR